jgi:outer membrane protein assembly factor BamB
MTTSDNSAERVARKAGAIRWWPAVVLLVAAGGAVAAVLGGWLALSGRVVLDAAAIVGVTWVGLYVWLIAWSGIGLSKRIKLFAALPLVIAAVTLTIEAPAFVRRHSAHVAPPWSAPPITFEMWRARSQTLRDNGQPVDLSATGPDDFPQFRGPERLGTLSGLPLARDWGRFPPRLLWKHPVGSGWSSFAVVGEYCVTQEQRGEFETVVCYELRTGVERWEQRSAARFNEEMAGEGPRATPTIHQGRVYALGATGNLLCLAGSDGSVIWSRNILEDGKCSNRPFGVCGSPLVMKGMVIVSPGCPGKSLVAYDAETGEPLWTRGDAAASYSSPQPATIAGVEQVLSFNADGLFAHDLARGDILWSYSWLTPLEMANICQPVVLTGEGGGADRVFISSGYGKGCAMLAIRRHGDRYEVVTQWTNRNLKAKFTSVAMRDGYVYGLDEAILTCIELETGARQWKGGRYGYGQLLLVDDLLLVQTESTDIALVEATPYRLTELTRFETLDSRSCAHPALAGRILLIRNHGEAACYELPVAEEDYRVNVPSP